VAFFLNYLFPTPPIFISPQESSLILKENILDTFNMGQERALSSFLWTQTMAQSDLEHYQKQDLNSWMFLRFSSILTLDPQFYECYTTAAQYLAIVKNDLTGAFEILKKAREKFPFDFWIFYFSGHFTYFEKKDSAESLVFFNQAIKNAERLQFVIPSYISFFIAKVKSQEIGTEEAIFFLTHEYERVSKDKNISLEIKEAYQKKIERYLKNK